MEAKAKQLMLVALEIPEHYEPEDDEGNEGLACDYPSYDYVVANFDGLQRSDEWMDQVYSPTESHQMLAAPDLYRCLAEVMREMDADILSRTCFTDQFIEDMRNALRKAESHG